MRQFRSDQLDSIRNDYPGERPLLVHVRRFLESLDLQLFYYFTRHTFAGVYPGLCWSMLVYPGRHTFAWSILVYATHYLRVRCLHGCVDLQLYSSMVRRGKAWGKVSRWEKCLVGKLNLA
jgi:hypothetical protein